MLSLSTCSGTSKMQSLRGFGYFTLSCVSLNASGRLLWEQRTRAFFVGRLPVMSHWQTGLGLVARCTSRAMLERKWLLLSLIFSSSFRTSLHWTAWLLYMRSLLGTSLRFGSSWISLPVDVCTATAKLGLLQRTGLMLCDPKTNPEFRNKVYVSALPSSSAWFDLIWRPLGTWPSWVYSEYCCCWVSRLAMNSCFCFNVKIRLPYKAASWNEEASCSKMLKTVVCFSLFI
jgi:hypothetical protein